MKYLITGTLQYDGQVEIEVDSAEEAVELFNGMTPDELDRSGLLFGNDCEIDSVQVLQDNMWVATDESY